MGDPRGDLGQWVAYLKEIGVRELQVPARPAGAPARVAAPRGGARSRPAGRATRAAPRAQKAAPPPAGDGLFPISNGPAPADRAGRLSEIRAEIGDCIRCKLHRGRTKIVFGVGSPTADLMFIGEGPGRDEDLQGEPFVGRAGKKLDEMIVAIGLSREQVYIANIVKCRPPDNRDPERDEVETCSPFLFAQIESIRPRVIVTLGGPATKLLLETRVGITRLRGEWQSFRGIPVMPTFHPAYVLRNYTREIRRQVWEDLKAARARVDRA